MKERTVQRLVDRPFYAYYKSVHQFGLRKSFFRLIYYSIATHLPMPGLPGALVGQWLRRACVKRLFKSCGVGVRIAAGVRFGSGAGMAIGNNSNISLRSWLLGDVLIGAHVMMGPEVTIMSENHSFSDVTRPMTLQGQQPSRPVIIEDDVWIGTRAIILPGVRIGSHSIVGAGSVVAKDVPAWAIVAGNPARVVNYRNTGDGRIPEQLRPV